MEKKTKRQIKVLMIGIVLLIVVVIGISYAYIKYESVQEEANVVGTECLKLTLVDESEAITIEKAFPLSDEEGKNSKPYRFTVENSCNTMIDYNINLEALEIENRMNSKYIAVLLDEEEIDILSNYKEARVYYEGEDYEGVESHTLYSSFLNPYEKRSHVLRLWVDESADNGSQEKTFLSKVVIEGTQNEVIASGENIKIKNEDAKGEVIEDIESTNRYAYQSTGSLVCEGEKPTCYFKADKEVEVTGVLLQVCGTKETPEDCIDVTEDEEVQANTWYKVKSNVTIKPKETEKEEIVLTSVVCVGNECSEKIESTLLKQDKEAPEIKVNTIESNYQGARIEFEASDLESGLESISCRYGLAEENLEIEGTISNGVCELKDFEIDKMYYYAIEGVDKVGNVRKLTGMISSEEKVTAPSLTGGSKDYAISRTIEIETPGVADTGVKIYEYYITNVKETPTSEVEISGTTENEVRIEEEGTWYVYFRTVSNQGNRSSWSGAEEVNIYYKASSVEYTNPSYLEIKNVQQAIEKIKEKWGIS